MDLQIECHGQRDVRFTAHGSIAARIPKFQGVSLSGTGQTARDGRVNEATWNLRHEEFRRLNKREMGLQLYGPPPRAR
jgi:hypothetical protein